jgi:predicted transcriptional regulator
MQDWESDQLRAFMNQRGLSQTALAKAVGVSQASVSRALARKGPRHGAARSKLFSYTGISEYDRQRSEAKGPKLVMAAFERVWDQSEAHAAAVARVIDALADLRPLPKDQKGNR